MSPNATVSYMAAQQHQVLLNRKLARASMLKEAQAMQSSAHADRYKASSRALRTVIARTVGRFGVGSKPEVEQRGAAAAG